jgi:anti-sigma B factor antagonist
MPNLDPIDAIEVRAGPRRTTVIPHGELDMATADRLSAEIEAVVGRGAADILLDLRQLSFIDVTGLRVVVRHACRDDVRVSVVDGACAVARLVELVGVPDEVHFVSPSDLEAG